MFIDGFVFATFAAAFAGRAHDALHVTSLWESWISAPVLIGTFFGGIGLGYVTDKIARKPMFIADLSVFLACAVLMFFVTSRRAFPGQVLEPFIFTAFADEGIPGPSLDRDPSLLPGSDLANVTPSDPNASPARDSVGSWRSRHEPSGGPART